MWAAVAVLAVVVVIGCVVAGYEINHLRNEVSGLQNQVTTMYQLLLKLGQSK